MTDRKKSPDVCLGTSGTGKPVKSAAKGHDRLTRRKRAVAFTVTPYDPDAAPVTIAVCRRVLWALELLVRAGPRGCSPITETAPRWAAYFHSLSGLGAPIDTIHEQHQGDFPGTLARYFLGATVLAVEASDRAALTASLGGDT